MGLSRQKIELLREFVDKTCEQCDRPEAICGVLQPHRIKQGGEYRINNLIMVCDRCHKIFSSE